MLLGTSLPQRLSYSTKELLYFHREKIKSNPLSSGSFGRAKTSNRKVLIIVPSVYWETTETLWSPGSGNIFFEIWQSAVESEYLEEVYLYKVNNENDDWHLHLTELVIKHDIGLILVDVEQNPTGSSNWDIDLKIQFIRKFWAGQIILFSIDMAFATHLERASKIMRNDEKSIVIAIDRNIKRFFFARGIGPLLAPISKKSFDYIDDQLKEPVEKRYQISFIGKIYTQRENVLKMIIDSGIDLIINPHHEGTNRASYISYIKALVESVCTLDLSKAGRDPISQKKSRLLEATSFGTPVLSDSRNNIVRNLPLEKGIYRFRSVDELQKVIKTISLFNDDSHTKASQIIKNEARAHATKNFWATIAKLSFNSSS